jgi:predicted phosphodiesterase
MARVGIIGDTHIPFEHEDYLQFCKDTFEAWEVDTVVHIGDLVDHHAMSFHDSEPMLLDAHKEMVNAKIKLKDWYEAFPDVTVIEGNHDIIPGRHLKKLEIDPSTWLRDLGEVYEMPEGWVTVQEATIDGVLYHHGHTANGVNGFRNDAARRMCNTVSGHCHSNAGISATASEHRLVWGLAVGCGVDNSAMAFAYGKHFTRKPIVACGIVIDGIEPHIEYMNLGEK